MQGHLFEFLNSDLIEARFFWSLFLIYQILKILGCFDKFLYVSNWHFLRFKLFS